MKKNSVFHFLFLFVFAVSACHKTEIPKDTPACIRRKINVMKVESVRNPPAEVWRFDSNGEHVYYISAQCCDIMSELFDEKCNLICHPDGGFAGGGDGQCTGARTNPVLIWKDDR